MLEIGILKNFNSTTYKAAVQLVGSLTTYFDNVSVAVNLATASMTVGNFIILAIPQGNPKDACVVATWPGGSTGIVKDHGGLSGLADDDHSQYLNNARHDLIARHTLGSVVPHDVFTALTDTPSSYSGQAGKYVKVNSGANALEFGLVATKFTAYASSNELWRGPANCCDSPFDALINGNPTATSVVYDNDTRENSLPNPAVSPQFGKVILHNITRGNSRKITSVNFATNTITTESSSDDWADNDIITIGSPTCDCKKGWTYSRFLTSIYQPRFPLRRYMP